MDLLTRAQEHLRHAWFKTDYRHKEPTGRLGVCVMGSLALASNPTLTERDSEFVWEDAANKALRSNPDLAQALEAAADARLAEVTEPRWVRKRASLTPANAEKWHSNLVGLKVCLTNIATIDSGEQAATFLDEVTACLAAIKLAA